MTYIYNGLPIELPEYASFDQIILWDMLGIPPMTPIYEKIHGVTPMLFEISGFPMGSQEDIEYMKSVGLSKKKIWTLFMNGDLTATGILHECELQENGWEVIEYKPRKISKHKLKRSKIPPALWGTAEIINYVDWNNSALILNNRDYGSIYREISHVRSPIVSFEDIQTPTLELIKQIPKDASLEIVGNKNDQKLFTTSYKTEHMLLMEYAIINEIPQQYTKEETQKWLQSQSQKFIGKKLSDKKAKAMATFLRPMKKTSGGKWKREDITEQKRSEYMDLMEEIINHYGEEKLNAQGLSFIKIAAYIKKNKGNVEPLGHMPRLAMACFLKAIKK